MTLSISPNYEVIPLFNKGIFVININIKKDFQKTSPPPITLKPRYNKDFRHFQGGGIFNSTGISLFYLLSAKKEKNIFTK